MDTKWVKLPYEDPGLEVLETDAEGMICASVGDYPEWPGEDIQPLTGDCLTENEEEENEKDPIYFDMPGGWTSVLH